MQTAAGSLALVGDPPLQDSTVAARLRAAGAVILGKANLSEWANFRSFRSSSGWSGRDGQCNNPYAIDRNPCGSSSGSAAAVSAGFCAAALGTETDGSVVCPSSACGVVGIKPTVGLTSRAGVVPISATQDTVGVHGRTVAEGPQLAGPMGLDAVMDDLGLDALAAPTASPAWTTDLINGDLFLLGSSSSAAVAGYPLMTVPAGFSFGLPVGITFMGRAFSEPTLIRLASGFERVTQVRRPPEFLPTLELEETPRGRSASQKSAPGLEQLRKMIREPRVPIGRLLGL